MNYEQQGVESWVSDKMEEPSASVAAVLRSSPVVWDRTVALTKRCREAQTTGLPATGERKLGKVCAPSLYLHCRRACR